MLVARNAGMPAGFFLGVAGFWCLVAWVAGPLYDLGIWVRKHLGLIRLADWGRCMRPRLLPPARVALLIMAVISLLAGVL
jgi:hypothetical protein